MYPCVCVSGTNKPLSTHYPTTMAPPPPNGLRGDMYSITTTGFHRRNSGAWTATTIPSSSSTITCTQSPLSSSALPPVWKRRRPSNHRLPLTHDRPTRSRSFFSKYDRRWRWWHVLFVLMVLLGVIQFVGVLVGSRLLHSKTASIRIGKK